MGEKGKLIFYDVEMVCDRKPMSQREMETIRIGATSYCQRTKKITSFDSFVRPSFTSTISGFCTNLTGISQKDIDGAESFESVFTAFMKWSGEEKNTHWYAWGTNDLKRFRYDAALHLIDPSLFNRMESNHTNLQKIFSLMTGMDRSLPYVLNRYGDHFTGPPHHPKYDAFNTLKVFRHFRERPHFNEYVFFHEHYFADTRFLSSMESVFNEMDENPTYPQDRINRISQRIERQVERILLEEKRTFFAELKESDIGWIRKRIRKTIKQAKRLSKRFELIGKNPFGVLVSPSLLKEERRHVKSLYLSLREYELELLHKPETSAAFFEKEVRPQLIINQKSV